MAYWSMTALTLMAILAGLGLTPDAATPLLETIAWVFGVVIVSYFGGNAAEVLAQRRR